MDMCEKRADPATCLPTAQPPCILSVVVVRCCTASAFFCTLKSALDAAAMAVACAVEDLNAVLLSAAPRGQ